MSNSGSDVDPTPSLSQLSTWHQTAWKPVDEQSAAKGRGSSVQDRISLFEANHNNAAGNTNNCNLATSKWSRRHSGFGNTAFVADKRESSSEPDDKDCRISRPYHHHHHLRTFSVEDCFQEQEEQEEGVTRSGEMMRGEMICSSTSGPSRGNQELNHQLQMKADELERLFAEHQRRMNGNSADKKPVDEEENSNRGIRGRLYERYMEKRYAKKREEWGMNREEKERKMRAMWEIAERSRQELKGWFERQELTDEDRKRVEKLGSSSEQLSLGKINQKTLISSEPADDDEDDTQSSDGSLKSVNSKMHVCRNFSSSASRVSGSAVPRYCKAPSSRSLRASALNSDFKKENTKPSTGISKGNTHAQPNGVARSKSSSAGINTFKEEKPPRSVSLRKSSAASLTPLRATKEQSGLKPTFRKGNGAGPGTGCSVSKLRTSISSDLNVTPSNVASVDIDASMDSPTRSSSSLYSQDGTRVRKKWGSVQIPFLVPDGSHHQDATKGLKKFLHFGKKSRGTESRVADLASFSAFSRGDYGLKLSLDLVSEQQRNSSIGYPLDSHDGFSFSEGMNRTEQVQTLQRSIPASANFKLRKDHLLESSPKSPRSFFSLSAFRNKGVESKAQVKAW